MKSKEFFGLMFNPFTRIAGWQAFGLGFILLIFMGIIGTSGNVNFDGVLDMHLVKATSFQQSFSILTIDLCTLILVMWTTGLIISKGFRFIDILGTMTLAKAPFILLALAGCFTTSPDTQEILKNPNVIFHSVSFIVLMLLTLPVLVWNITLMYNAMKVSCDIKGNKLTIAFILALLMGEIISKTLIYYILPV